MKELAQDKIVYVADLDQDVDDIIAAEYLYRNNMLHAVVASPYPTSKEGLQRMQWLLDHNIKVHKKSIPPGTQIIFIGGAFTAVAEYLKKYHCKLIVANGGFVGNNIVRFPLTEFHDKQYVRTYNFDLDVDAIQYILNNRQKFDQMILVGKNVCHSYFNTAEWIWKDQIFLRGYNLRAKKKLHDLMMCSEGLHFVQNEQGKLLCNYSHVDPVTPLLQGNMTQWGSVLNESSNIIAAIDFKCSE